MMNTRRTLRTITAAVVLSTGLSAFPLLAPRVAAAQDRGPVQRVIKGKVEEKGGAPVKGAVVYLRDGRTSTVRSAITQDDGTFRFVQLLQGTDYDLWAQLDNKKSKTKSISSFDTKNEFNMTLTID